VQDISLGVWVWIQFYTLRDIPLVFFPEDWLFRSFRWPRLFFLFNLIESIPAMRCPEIVASASGAASHMFLMFAEHGLAATGAL